MSEKNTTPETEVKGTQGEVELKYSQKFMSELDDNISDSEKVMEFIFVFMLKNIFIVIIYI